MFNDRNIKSFKNAALCLLACAAISPASAAEELISGDLPGTFEGSITTTTDYVFRGISQSNEKPAVQAGLTWSHDSGIYLGFWGSSVDYADGDDSTTEMDAFIGYASSIGDFSYDIGFTHYFYPGTDRRLNYDFSEVILGLSYDFDYFSLGTTVAWSPEYWGDSGEAFYTAADVSVPFKYGISFDAGIGHQTMQMPSGYGLGNDYTEWHAGLTVPIKNFDLNLMYSDTDFTRAECADGCEARWVASITYNF